MVRFPLPSSGEQLFRRWGFDGAASSVPSWVRHCSALVYCGGGTYLRVVDRLSCMSGVRSLLAYLKLLIAPQRCYQPRLPVQVSDTA